MAEIIRQGYPRTRVRVARHECKACESLVEYTHEDVHFDGRDGNYVICPACKEWIATSILRWQYPEPNNSDPDWADWNPNG
jgi:hypothetical protein